MKIFLPEKVKTIINILNSSGFEAFAVGGCVRDSLMGLTPHDWDICTSAKPEQIKACFSNYKMFDTGIKHGTVSVVIDGEVFEITTYRIDGEYRDNRRPDSVAFTDSITSDLSRRDFTVNAIAYNDEYGLADPFGGIADIKSKTLRCVGDPNRRFNEDALRILRALRFSAVYGLCVEKATSKAIINNRNLLKNIAAERIASELSRLLCGDNAENILIEYREVFAVFIPEIRVMFDFDQHTKHHEKDVWRHTCSAVSFVPPTPLLRMTMLLHDIGKPSMCKRDSNGTCHFKGHPKVSAEIAQTVLKRLKYPSKFNADCTTLIKFHDVRLNGDKNQMKRVMNAIGKENTSLLLSVQRADILAQSQYKRQDKLTKLASAVNSYKEIIKNDECYCLKTLAVNGNDLKLLGLKDGRQIGELLKQLLNDVIDEKVKNEKSALLMRAASLLNLQL